MLGPIQTTFAPSINRLLTNAHYEGFLPSKHRLIFEDFKMNYKKIFSQPDL